MATEGQNDTLPEAPNVDTPLESEPKEVTKRSIRVETWLKIKEQKLTPPRRYSVFNRIPNFTGAEKAAELLAATEEFKKANSIMVNIDVAQEPVKLEVIKAHKTLFVSPTQKSAFVYAKIKNCNPDEVDLATQKKIIKLQGEADTYNEIDINGVEKLDMVVVGSCAVSRLGHRIGKGNGYVDLDIGIQTHLGVITKDTLIVTTVHDVQVYDTLPEKLFQSYDLPLDIIVTPSEVIHVSKRLTRPTGINWNLLSSRRLEIVPVLKSIKEKEENNGVTIVLKDEDTDVESYQQKAQKRWLRRGHLNQRRRRRSDRRVSEKEHNGGVDESHDDEGAEKTDGEVGDGDKQGSRPRRFRRYIRGPRRSFRRGSLSDAQENAEKNTNGGEGRNNRRRRMRRSSDPAPSADKLLTGSEGEEGGKSADVKKGGREFRRRGQKNVKNEKRGNRVDRDLCIRVSNISRTMRIKELKQELRNRECNPIFITWNGFHGKCYLHFPKKPDQNDDEAGADLLKRLENLTLAVSPREKENGSEPKQVTLVCEIMKRKENNNGSGDAPQPATNGTVLEGSRIETTDVTAV